MKLRPGPVGVLMQRMFYLLVIIFVTTLVMGSYKCLYCFLCETRAFVINDVICY